MSKRKQLDSEDAVPDTPSKRYRKTAQPEASLADSRERTSKRTSSVSPRKTQTTPSKRKGQEAAAMQNHDRERGDSPTPKANRRAAFSTPRKDRTLGVDTPSKARKADQSAKRKSARRLAETDEEDDWGGEETLATEILGDEDEDGAVSTEILDTVDIDTSTPTATPSKRGRGRPKGSKNKRSPTPEGEIAPDERYFFQNRTGPPQHSSNTFSSVKLLTHDEYFEQQQRYENPHQVEKAFLTQLHRRSFPQWKFELLEGYSVCLYGYGSKRHLINQFAEWLHLRTIPHPQIVIVNGYTPKLSIKNILSAVGSTLVGEDEALKLTGQPQEMLESLLSYLSEHPPAGRLVVMINSIDALSLRKGTVQSVLARLSAHPLIHLIATADTPAFSLLWNSNLLDQFQFVFHDCTTFAPYEVELSVVDEIYDLLGRKGRRMGGKDGIGFVLKSLPPNARNLYRILLSEILPILNDDLGAPADDGPDDDEASRMKSSEAAEDVGIEYRILYQKASEEFICSSDMNFRFLLKEFHDHQMITSRRDASGTELLCVPLGKEEMQAVLEDLVVTGI